MSRLAKQIAFIVTEQNCHECTSHTTNGKGYPIVVRNHKFTTIVRFLYQQKYGTLSSTTILRHTCDNKKCINVAHITTGTIIDNIKDRVQRNRCARGEKHGSAKLTEKEVNDIRQSKESLQILSERYGVTKGMVSHIRTRRCWN